MITQSEDNVFWCFSRAHLQQYIDTTHSWSYREMKKCNNWQTDKTNEWIESRICIFVHRQIFRFRTPKYSFHICVNLRWTPWGLQINIILLGVEMSWSQTQRYHCTFSLCVDGVCLSCTHKICFRWIFCMYISLKIHNLPAAQTVSCVHVCYFYYLYNFRTNLFAILFINNPGSVNTCI